MVDFYFDNTNGINTNPGTKALPKKDNLTANFIWAAGNRLLLKAGETWQENIVVPNGGVDSNPIEIGQYGAVSNPMLSGGNADPVLDGEGIRANCISAVNISYLDINGIELKSAAGSNLVIEQSNNINIIGLNIHSAQSSGINSMARNNNDVFNILIKNTKIHNNGAVAIFSPYGSNDGITIGALYDYTVDNCRIYDNGSDGIIWRSNLSYTTVDPEHSAWGLIVRNTKIYSNGGVGIYARNILGAIQNKENSQIHNNIIYDNSAITTLGGVWFGYVSNLDCYQNEIFKNHTTGVDGSGILIDNGCNRVRCYHNTVYGHIGSEVLNSGQGIAVFDSANSEIFGNICYENKWNLWAGAPTATGHIIYNNTCVNPSRSNLWINSDVPENGLNIKNNIFFGGDYGIEGQGGGNAQLADYNLYFDFSLAALKALPLSDKSLITNPDFLDININDFRLKAGSPGINLGVNLPTVLDKNGTPYLASSPDIGALEYLGDNILYSID